MRKHLSTVALFVAGFAACSSDSRNPLGLESIATSPAPAIADAPNGGREGFYFLQPIVANPKVSGPFDATLIPRVRICALDASRTACSSNILATIPTGSGPERLTVDPKDGSVTGQWMSPATLELSTASGDETRYRLEVLRQAMADAAGWPELITAINISPISMIRSDFSAMGMKSSGRTTPRTG